MTCATERFNNCIDEQLIHGQAGHRSNAGVRAYKRQETVRDTFVLLARILTVELCLESSNQKPISYYNSDTC